MCWRAAQSFVSYSLRENSRLSIWCCSAMRYAARSRLTASANPLLHAGRSRPCSVCARTRRRQEPCLAPRRRARRRVWCSTVPALQWSRKSRSSCQRRAILGGFGLPAPVLNKPLSFTRPDGAIVRKGDLLWERHAVVIEYDSSEHHEGEANIDRDARRRNEFIADAYRVLTVTKQQAHDLASMEHVARHARALARHPAA